MRKRGPRRGSVNAATTDVTMFAELKSLYDNRDPDMPDKSEEENSGKEEFYTHNGLLRRESLRFDKAILQAIGKLFGMCDVNTDGKISVEEYRAIYAESHLLLIGEGEVLEEDFEAEWRRDAQRGDGGDGDGSGGGSDGDGSGSTAGRGSAGFADTAVPVAELHMDWALFSKAIFQLADLWTEDICKDEYVEFLESLILGIKRKHCENGSGQSDSAATATHTEPAAAPPLHRFTFEPGEGGFVGDAALGVIWDYPEHPGRVHVVIAEGQGTRVVGEQGEQLSSGMVLVGVETEGKTYDFTSAASMEAFIGTLNVPVVLIFRPAGASVADGKLDGSGDPGDCTAEAGAETAAGEATANAAAAEHGGEPGGDAEDPELPTRAARPAPTRAGGPATYVAPTRTLGTSTGFKLKDMILKLKKAGKILYKHSAAVDRLAKVRSHMLQLRPRLTTYCSPESGVHSNLRKPALHLASPAHLLPHLPRALRRRGSRPAPGSSPTGGATHL